MKWVSIKERFPEQNIGITYVGKNEYGAYDLFSWDSMMQFFRPAVYEYGEMMEWLDETPDLLNSEQEDKRSVATGLNSKTDDDTIKTK